MLKKILALVCVFSIIASFATINIAHADDAMVTTSITVEESGKMQDLRSTLKSFYAPYSSKGAYPLYKVTINVDGFKDADWDTSPDGAMNGLTTNGANIVVKFDNTIFEYVIASDYTNLSEGVADHAELSWMSTESTIPSPFVMYFIPVDGQTVTKEATFAITSTPANAAGALTTFTVDYYDENPGWDLDWEGKNINTADGKVGTSSFTLNKKEEPALTAPEVGIETDTVKGPSGKWAAGILGTVNFDPAKNTTFSTIEITPNNGTVDAKEPVVFTVADGTVFESAVTVKCALNITKCPDEDAAKAITAKGIVK